MGTDLLLQATLATVGTDLLLQATLATVGTDLLLLLQASLQVRVWYGLVRHNVAQWKSGFVQNGGQGLHVEVTAGEQQWSQLQPVNSSEVLRGVHYMEEEGGMVVGGKES